MVCGLLLCNVIFFPGYNFGIIRIDNLHGFGGGGGASPSTLHPWKDQNTG